VEAGSAWQSVVEKAGGPYWKDQDSSHCWETVWAWRPKPAWKSVTYHQEMHCYDKRWQSRSISIKE